MKKYFVYLISILLIASTTNSCKHTKNTDEKQKHSHKTTNNQNINLKKLQPYVLETYKDGKIKKIKYFEIKNEKKVFKYYKELYPDGSTKIEGPLKNNQREGHWIYFYDNGVKWSEGNYINGKAVGKFTIRYKDGNLWEEIYYKQGVKSKEVVYDKNGKVVDERKYQ